MNILVVNSSIKGALSVTRGLIARTLDRLKAVPSGSLVIYVDLCATPVPYLTPAVIAARMGLGDADDPAYLAHQTALEAFLAADLVIIGAPMYNFGVPAQLKSWLDALAVAGKTFRYTEHGPEGLCAGKRVLIVSSRGGFYEPPSPRSASDHQEAHLLAFFEVFGITNIDIIRAEGTDVSPALREAAVTRAQAQLESVALSA